MCLVSILFTYLLHTVMTIPLITVSCQQVNLRTIQLECEDDLDEEGLRLFDSRMALTDQQSHNLDRRDRRSGPWLWLYNRTMIWPPSTASFLNLRTRQS